MQEIKTDVTKSIMKLSCSILFFIVLLSCTGKNEDTTEDFSIVLKNGSSSTVRFEGWGLSKKKIEEVVTDNSPITIAYTNEAFKGLFGKVDSIVFKFENGKGYICTGEPSDEICFENRNAFDKEGFIDLNKNRYEFVITQEDFENAHNLP